MKRKLYVLGIIFGGGYFLALCWWNLWMFNGWIGAPEISGRILRNFCLVDGEVGYDCAFFDMAIVVWICLFCLLLLYCRINNVRRN